MSTHRAIVALLVSLATLVALPSAQAARHRKHVVPVVAPAPITISTLAGYASQVAGSPVTIACDTAATESGSAAFDGVIHLSAQVCLSLTQADQPALVNSWTGFAMLILQHEAEHIALNSGDEGLVECAAVTNRYELVHLFHLPTTVGIRIMAWERDQHQKITDPAYRTVC